MDNAKTPRIWRLCNSVAVTLRSFGALAPREVRQQLEPSVGQILLILDQSLELFEPLIARA
jgi:hypothetical protein